MTIILKPEAEMKALHDEIGVAIRYYTLRTQLGDLKGFAAPNEPWRGPTVYVSIEDAQLALNKGQWSAPREIAP